MSNRGTFLFSVEKCRFRTSRNTRSPSPGCGSPPDSLAYAASGKVVDVLLPKSTGNIAAILPLNVFRHEFETLSGVTTESAFPPNRLFRVLAPETHGWCEPHGWACCGGDSRRGHSRHKSRRVWSGSAATRKYDTRKTKSIPMERCMDGREPKGPAELALEPGISLRTCRESGECRMAALMRCAGRAGFVAAQDDFEAIKFLRRSPVKHVQSDVPYARESPGQ